MALRKRAEKAEKKNEPAEAIDHHQHEPERQDLAPGADHFPDVGQQGSQPLDVFGHTVHDAR